MWNANLIGMGYTMKGNKRSFQETLSIITIKDTLYLEVKNINEQPTFFKFTSQTDTSFVCENPENEFPKNTYLLYCLKSKCYYQNDRMVREIISWFRQKKVRALYCTITTRFLGGTPPPPHTFQVTL